LAIGLIDYPNPRVVVQRVAATGARMWGDDGITVRSRAGACTIPAIVGDGGGGALVFWGQWDAIGTSIQISGQHIDASGRALWDTEGRAVSTASYNQIVEAIPADGGSVWANYRTAIAATSDGKTGAILTWAGARGADLNIIAARVGPDGGAPWGHDVTVCAAPSWQATVDCASWQDGGALIAWRDGRAGSDVGIYAQAIDHGGRARWASDGIPLALGRGDRGPALAVADGRAGTYLAWLEPSDSGRVVAQRLLHSGRPAPGWADGGVRVSRFAEPDYGGNVGLSLVGSVAGTALVAWTSWRRESYVMLLTPHGLPVQDVPGRKRRAVPLAELSSDAGGAMFAIHGVQPNPMTVGSVVHLALPGSSDALLEMFDITGRRVWARDLSGLSSGEHEVPVGDRTRLPVGLYLIRLSQAGQVAHARVIVAR